MKFEFLTARPSVPRVMRRVRRWGDPVMVPYGFNVTDTSNFQAVKCYNEKTGFGAVTNYLYIPNNQVLQIRDMQITTDGFTRNEKMEWQCSYRGSIYMYDNPEDSWKDAPRIRWGTLTLGGNVVQVAEYREMELVINGQPRALYNMARLVGFKPSDFARPLNELIAEGLVHRAYCAYKNNQFGDSPKGIVYTPFFDPDEYDFAGNAQPTALWLPEMWLE